MNPELLKIQTAISSMLNVRDGARAVDFYKAAFGAEVLFRIDDNHSVVAQLSIASAAFWVADEAVEYHNPSPQTLNGSSFRMILVLDDPDSTFKQAIVAGAKEISPMQDHSYGWRVGRVMDPFGHHWEIGKPISATA
jgi:PhnB protein